MNHNEIILALLSVAMLAFGLFSLERNKRLQRIGKKTTAVIFTNNYKSSHPTRRGNYYPVVRFVTEDEQWITQELNTGQNPPMREGK